METIIRYKNRKMYSKRLSQCVTTSDIATMLKDGKDVVILDRESGLDVTAKILTEVLVAQTVLNKTQLVNLIKGV